MSEGGGSAVSCWCGETPGRRFSPEYSLCDACGGTLVLNAMPDPAELAVGEDESGLYGKEYWLTHLPRDYGQPDIRQRARIDLPERCLFWLETLLRYRLPPGRTLELGSAHGGFVAMLAAAGFEARGLELSPWVAGYAHDTFGVETLVGPIEEQQVEPGSLDVIAMMDVLEHLPDPLRTIRRCAELLRPDGILLVQTPLFAGPETKHEDLVEAEDPFAKVQLKEMEHLFLFSLESVDRLMQRAGLPHVEFETAIFDYDMFFVASREKIERLPAESVEERLLESPGARLVLALLDLHQNLDRTEADRRGRIEEIATLGGQLEALSADYQRRGEVIEEVEADRRGRLEQIATLTRQLEELSADYERRGRVIEERQAKIEALEAERPPAARVAGLVGKVEKLQAAHATSRRELEANQERLEANQERIEELESEIRKESGRAAKLVRQLDELTDANDRARSDLAEHRARIEQLQATLAERDDQVERLHEDLREQRARAGNEDARAELERLEADREERIATISTLNRHLEALSADYERRLEVILEQRNQLRHLHGQLSQVRKSLLVRLLRRLRLLF